MIFRAFAVWFALLILSSLNGAFREAVLIPRMGIEGGHFVSSIALCLIILGIVLLAAPWIRIIDTRHAIEIGLGWVALTLMFEFGFGHFVRHRPWSELLVDYNVLKGRIWILVLLTITVAPLVAARVRGLIPRASP
jgi:hypothetical protein